ncbi:hypothetical protein D9M68_961290 [compost metagenome]
MFHGVRRKGGQGVVKPVLGLVLVHAHQYAGRQSGEAPCLAAGRVAQRVRNVFGPHQRAAADGVHHAAGAEKGVEVHRADGRTRCVVVQRRVGVCTHVG